MISLWLMPQEIQYCQSMAKMAEIGGLSSIRKDNREQTLTADQIVGQMGQYALAMYLFGEPSRYYVQRLSSNLSPKIGDAGQDFLGANVDVKTSLMRGSMDITTYRLAVRPNERHIDHVYYLALVKPNGETSLSIKENILVHIVGWALDGELPAETNEKGTFSGAYTIMASGLHEPAPIKWDWRKYA